MKVLVVRRRRARARDRPRPRPLGRPARAPLRARQRRDLRRRPLRRRRPAIERDRRARRTPRRCDLVVVGPEAPLVDGLVDALEAARRSPPSGPSAEAARLEGSKVHAKALMAEAGVPTAGHAVLRSRDEALEQLACASYPAVLKADGLAAGKGVIICATEAEAREAVEAFFVERRFGATEVVLEEYLDGEELSLLALCDGENVRPARPGAGLQADLRRRPRARTPAAWAATRRSRASTPSGVEEIADAVHRPIVELMRRRGTPFHGVLYAGLMLTADGPEGARVQLPLRRSRDAGGAAAAARPTCSSSVLAAREPGGLAGAESSFADDWAVTVVLASAGYPESSSKGDVISGLDRVPDGGRGHPRRHRPHRRRDVVTAGGRVLNVTALGPTPAQARERAYAAAELIEFEGKQMRTDIAARAADARRRRLTRQRGAEWRSRSQRRAPRPGVETPASAPPEPMPEVEAAFEEIEVDAPRVGIIMGSKNDKPKMQPAGAGAAGGRDPLRGPGDERPPRPREGARVLPRRAHARPQGDHRRRRDVGGAARGRRRAHRPAGDRRADPRQEPRRPRRAALGGADAARACRSPASRSTAPRTPACSRCGSSHA